MQVFQTTIPTLSFIEAAGQAIVEGSVASVQIDLPAGSSPARTVKLRARNFTGVVPIRVRASPETGTSTDYDTTVDMAGNPFADVTVNLTLPTGTVTHISAWTR